MTNLGRLAAVLAAAPAVTAIYINGSVIAPCDSPIYCYGDLLKEIELARPFADSKTFVDMPALKPLEEIQSAFSKLQRPIANNSELNTFLASYFADAGHELQEVPKSQLKTDPQFLASIDDTVIREFTQKVIDIWPSLTRSYNASAASTCADCPSSFIPIKRPFGLLRTRGSFTEIAKNTIENFLDLVEQYGIVPNGARVYYLNRSQPPMLSQMVKLYIDHTNDTTILARALPLLVREHDFWMANRTVEVSSGGQTYRLNRYAVDNTEPRPESYREDHETARNSSYHAESGIIYPETRRLNASEYEALYANLATGAETGWDFSSRWIANPRDSARQVYFPLRSMNARSIVPVCLNSILYGNELAIAGFLRRAGNASAAPAWERRAADRSAAMHALMWNDTLAGYFDFNLTSSGQDMYALDDDADDADDAVEAHTRGGAPPGHKVLFHAGQFYPFWQGAAPAHLKNNPHAVRAAYARVEAYLGSRKGGIPATNLRAGQQWDRPNVWPPLMHILIKGLANTPATFGPDDPAYRGVRALALALAQRYLDSAFCTWYATGGSTTETPKLDGLGDQDTGVMFEKYSDESTNVAGGGGEYEVVEGFGWTNGVLIWAVDFFRGELKRPDCGDLEAARHGGGKRKRARSAVELPVADARRIKRFART
ncbi:trehalase precursor [Metarhizium acridum CQMa 102]|uniref:Trehalase n=1 Tax=Metarhizium acridum (strain CQMa 102) TaxID=655827 RepID=E9ED64_METAQ|nr:trehalase precursor [Metarhizium acridum CQMa 102]EFY86147.1 trehalase precursor [Metarhizium acridum CQMa 102]